MSAPQPPGPPRPPGALAQVIAARGGRADPEAPFEIEHREALIYMLCEAAELEHSIMCEYLFAAFSLKQRVEEGLTEDELAAVTRWRRTIAHVATEEMLHLALVHNLLSAIGAAPHLGRPNMPAPARHYPTGVVLALVPFGEPAVRHFMFLERPEGMELEDAEELAARDSGLAAAGDQAKPLLAERDIVPRLQDFATVGHLYRSIEQGFAHLAAKFGERALFVGPPKAQATSENFRWPELVAVRDLASAQRAIDTILEQGEGARGDWEDAHFGQFVEILGEYQQLKEANPGFEPARPVMHANVRPCEHAEVPLIGDPLTARCTDLFNVGYEVLLQALERYFAHTEETDGQLATLADATLGLMLRVLKPLGDLITTLPVGPRRPGATAGPSFELFYESDYLMPHRDAAWALLEERLREAATFCQRIEDHADEALAGALAPVRGALGEIADSLAAHFPDWGALSRFATHGSAASHPDGADVGSLMNEATRFAETAAGAAIADEAGQAVRELFIEAHRFLAGGAASGDDPSGAGPAEQFPPVAARLVNSVLRPLSEALAARGTGRQSQDGPTVVAAETDGGRGAEDGLFALAQAATRLRARLVGDAQLGPALAEATAALQDLVVTLAPSDGPEGGEARLDPLREIQADVPLGIQVATDGPYLVSSAANVYDWLGVRVPVRPQLALCRCGQSAMKPLCDGSHARVGFTGAKDPKRVPDRRDSYVGQQVTVLDNRGTCQHSGYCTDRLATAFHLGEEPFVTPSGGRLDEIIRAVRDCPSGALGFAIDGVEARDDVEYHGKRPPAIEVTKDGPYRISGGIPLSDGEGGDEKRNEGASLEHYALCRCGHSQNKPFCSGMHWYVEFKDPVPDPARTPTMFEWCGGLPALTRMTRLFYEKHVPQDPLLAPLFAEMSPDHPQRVAKWLGEVFGGPECYSQEFGGYPRMISQHLGKQLSEDQRARWVALILRSAGEAGLPADPEFQAAFRSYLEWGSRIAVENSQTEAEPPANMPVPRWGWVCDAAPGSRVSTLPTDEESEGSVVLPGPDEAVGYEKHIKPLFRQRDRQSMRFAFDLWSYDDVKQHADGIAERLRDGSMPCDGAWPQERVDVFQRWIDTGMAA